MIKERCEMWKRRSNCWSEKRTLSSKLSDDAFYSLLIFQRLLVSPLHLTISPSSSSHTGSARLSECLVYSTHFHFPALLSSISSHSLLHVVLFQMHSHKLLIYDDKLVSLLPNTLYLSGEVAGWSFKCFQWYHRANVITQQNCVVCCYEHVGNPQREFKF